MEVHSAFNRDGEDTTTLDIAPRAAPTGSGNKAIFAAGPPMPRTL